MERKDLKWLDMIKATALIWVFTNHVVERIFGFPYIANPTANWPPFSVRVAQLRPIEEYGFWNLPINLARYIGWTGDQGVNLFLIISGFGLTWGLLLRNGFRPIDYGSFYRKRVIRIYPLWVGAHLLFMIPRFLTNLGISPFEPATYLSMAGIRFTQGLFYFFTPAWWYIGLLLQLYMIYPFLWTTILKLGERKFLVGCCVAGFLARYLGLLIFESYLDKWLLGAFFITRIPEFSLGICLAVWLYRSPEDSATRLRANGTLAYAVGIYVLATFISLTSWGMTIAPFLLGGGGFIVLYRIFGGFNASLGVLPRIATWIGRHSFSLYLVHHPLILYFVQPGFEGGGVGIVLRIIAALISSLILSIALERAVGWIEIRFGEWYRTAGIVGVGLRLAAVAAALFISVTIVEYMVRRSAPQEVISLGWGEKDSLAPDNRFGWRLKPSMEIRLQWEGYDYVVRSNSLGFPGPEYPKSKGRGTLRILTTGDAYTSAEGVDTELSWPRLLETGLHARFDRKKVEVMNFAITGYGPNEYAKVVEFYAPIYRPDLIIIEFFVNDYQDVLHGEEFCKSIGFGIPEPSIFKPYHIREFFKKKVTEPMREIIKGEPRANGYFLGNFSTLERVQPKFPEAREMVRGRLKKIKSVAEKVGAKVVIVMVPAPVQVCLPDQLPYYPRIVNLRDRNKFDIDLPQRTTRELAHELSIIFFDLRENLISSSQFICPYHPQNMHFTAEGHRIIADFLADKLILEGIVRGS